MFCQKFIQQHVLQSVRQFISRRSWRQGDTFTQNSVLERYFEFLTHSVASQSLPTGTINQVWDIGHMQHINMLALCMLHWVHILHKWYVTCLVPACAYIWSTNIGKQVFCLSSRPVWVDMWLAEQPLPLLSKHPLKVSVLWVHFHIYN